jgi:hypothetical protein
MPTASTERFIVTRPQKITFGEMRESGVREVLIYCRDHRCSRAATITADRQTKREKRDRSWLALWVRTDPGPG